MVQAELNGPPSPLPVGRGRIFRDHLAENPQDESKEGWKEGVSCKDEQTKRQHAVIAPIERHGIGIEESHAAVVESADGEESTGPEGIQPICLVSVNICRA
jgi:hypothetical protein